MPTYDGEPGPELSLLKTLAADGANVSSLYLGIHSGTHVDAPSHFFEGGSAVDKTPLDALVGLCLVLEVPGNGHLSSSDLEQAGLPASVERVLLKTGNSRLWSDSAFR